MKKDKGEFCEVCGAFVKDFEYQICCNGFECGCMGLPVEPCVCSMTCWEEICCMGPVGKDI